MKILLVAALLTSCLPAMANEKELYVKVGAGYKFDEATYYTHEGRNYDYENLSPISARIEVGIENGNFSYGISHHSQWLTGWPINNQGEPHKTEIFIDYKISWGM